MTNKQKCIQIANEMGVKVSIRHEGRYVTVEAESPTCKMFATTESHYLVCSEFAGFKGAGERLWADMAERLTCEYLTDCTHECDCWELAKSGDAR